MDFLTQLAMPQSAEHINVLHFVLNFVNVIFMPFLSLLFGLTLLSLYYNRIGRKQSDRLLLQLAKNAIDTIVPNRSILILLGIVPYLAIVFAYSQLLQSSFSSSPLIMVWGFFFFVAGVFFIYSYQLNFKLSSMLESVASTEEVEEYKKESLAAHLSSGNWGFFMLTIGVYFFFAGIEHATDPMMWNISTAFGALFSFSAFVKFIQFVITSVALSTVAILYFTFAWQGGHKNRTGDYDVLVKKKLLPLALITNIAVPLFIVGSLMLLPVSALSGTVFVMSICAFISIIFVSHALYGLIKEFNLNLINNAFYLFIVAFFFLTIADQSAISKSTQIHSALVAYQYDVYHETLLAKMGLGAKPFSGEEIFAGKCSACHEFGAKKIGPAYKDVLPKYENDKAALLIYILNPSKKNPAFPPMPNQGLRPAEVDSIAGYIMTMYKK